MFVWNKEELSQQWKESVTEAVTRCVSGNLIIVDFFLRFIHQSFRRLITDVGNAVA
jgi:hypothetical protein